MSNEDVKSFVDDVLNGDLLDAREKFEDIMDQKKREKEQELYDQANKEFKTVKNDKSL